MVANEVCSRLDVVAEVTTRIQGSTDTHISQTMFNMLEVKDVLTGSIHDIRTPHQSCSVGAVPTEPTPVGDLTPEAKKVRKVLLEKMGADNEGRGHFHYLDWKRDICPRYHLFNGSIDIAFHAEDDVKTVADTCEGAVGGGRLPQVMRRPVRQPPRGTRAHRGSRCPRSLRLPRC